MEMKPFEKTDWYGYAGAESWPNGDLPLIGQGKLTTGEEFELIIDATGGCLMLDDEQAEAGGYTLELSFPTQGAAKALAAGIETPARKLDILTLGFGPNTSMHEALQDLLESALAVAIGEIGDDEIEVPDKLRGLTRVETLRDAGVLTADKGFVLRLLDGSEYHLTIQQTK